MVRYNIIFTLLMLICCAFVFYTKNKPIVFDGKFISGGISAGCPCSTTTNKYCRSRDDFKCSIYTLRCTGSGSLTCMEPGGTGSQPCWSSEASCYNDVIQDCE